MGAVERISLDNTTSQFIVAASTTEFSIFKLGIGEKGEDVYPILTQSLESRQREPVVEVSWLQHDNGLIVSSHARGSLYLWESSTLSIVEAINLGDNIICHTMSPSLSFTHASLAVARKSNIAMVDIRTGSAMQVFKTPTGPSALVWDRSNDFYLYAGLQDGSVSKWDIRRPSGNLPLLRKPIGREHSIVQLDFLEPDNLIYTTKNGFVGSIRISGSESPRQFGEDVIRTSNLELYWQSELDFNILTGFRSAVVQDTLDPLMILPAGDLIVALNLRSGEEAWRKTCNKADHLLYNHDRCELYNMELDGLSISSFCV
jgi:WD40 repeat protein